MLFHIVFHVGSDSDIILECMSTLLPILGNFTIVDKNCNDDSVIKLQELLQNVILQPCQHFLHIKTHMRLHSLQQNQILGKDKDYEVECFYNNDETILFYEPLITKSNSFPISKTIFEKTDIIALITCRPWSNSTIYHSYEPYLLDSSYFSEYKLFELQWFQLKQEERIQKLTEGLQFYNKYPKRMEVLYLLLSSARQSQLYSVASMLLERCFKHLQKEKKQKSQTQWFGIDVSIYHWKLFYESSIISFYEDKKQLGLKHIDFLMSSICFPYHSVSENVLFNLQFYVECLSSLIIKQKEWKGEEKNHFFMNPSIVLNSSTNEIVCNIRELNCNSKFQIFDELTHKWVGCSKEHKVYTRNFFTSNEKQVPKLVTYQPDSILFDSVFCGVEDVRMFYYKNTLFGLGTSQQFNCSNYNQMILWNASINKLIPITSPNPFRHEKNWLVLVENERIFIFYSYSPLTIYELLLDNEQPKLTLYMKREYVNLPSNLRGSANPVYYQNRYYCIVHQVLPGRKYIHRLLRFNQNFCKFKLSKPFQINGHFDVEYVCGLVIKEPKMYISWGQNDEQAFITSFFIKEIFHFLF